MSGGNLKIGDRVRNKDWGLGTVRGVDKDDDNVAVEFDSKIASGLYHSCSGLVPNMRGRWMYSWELEKHEAAGSSPAETVAKLRKAAGLPQFIVGDRVRVKRGSGWSFDGQEGEVREVVDTFAVVYIAGQWRGCGPFSVMCYSLELVTPAPVAKTEPAPTPRTFKVGDFVRSTCGGEAFKIIHDDGDDEAASPYHAVMVGYGAVTTFDADQLEPWEPQQLDTVRDKETGAIGEVVMAFSNNKLLAVEFDRLADPKLLPASQLEPGESPKVEPAPTPQYRPGVAVKIKDNSKFATGVAVGDVAVVRSKDTLVVDLGGGALEQIYDPQHVEPLIAA